MEHEEGVGGVVVGEVFTAGQGAGLGYHGGLFGLAGAGGPFLQGGRGVGDHRDAVMGGVAVKDAAQAAGHEGGGGAGEVAGALVDDELGLVFEDAGIEPPQEPEEHDAFMIVGYGLSAMLAGKGDMAGIGDAVGVAGPAGDGGEVEGEEAGWFHGLQAAEALKELGVHFVDDGAERALAPEVFCNAVGDSGAEF